MEEVEPRLFLVHNDNGFECTCEKCGKTLSEGTTYIKVVIEGRDYNLGYDPPRICCGIEAGATHLFDDADELREKVEALVDHLNDPESDECFCLVETPVDPKKLI